MRKRAVKYGSWTPKMMKIDADIAQANQALALWALRKAAAAADEKPGLGEGIGRDWSAFAWEDLVTCSK